MEHAGQVRARDVGLAPSAWRARLTHADARLDAVWLPADASKLEIKIPWMVIGFSDPSQHVLYGYESCGDNRTYSFVNSTAPVYLETLLLSQVDPRYRSTAFLNGGMEELANETSAVYTNLQAFSVYWQPWNVGCYCERYKTSAGTLSSFFGAIHGLPIGQSGNFTFNGTGISLPRDNGFCECINDCA